MSKENMNAVSEELIAKQKEEALERMQMLKILGDVRNAFRRSGKLYVSERRMIFAGAAMAVLYIANKEEMNMVSDWEAKTGYKVYHLIKNRMEFGLCYSFLYVSNREEEWENDRKELADENPFVYVYNKDCPHDSEYGSIGVAPSRGGVLRTA